MLRGFARGRMCLPAGGAATVPERLAATLPPGTVLTGVRVKEASITTVTTAEHGELSCRALLVATGRATRGRTAAGAAGARLPPGDSAAPHR